MGEWGRARDAIHDAPTREARDKAIDEWWRLAQAAYAESVSEVPYTVLRSIAEPSSTERLVLDWVRRELTKILDEPPG